MAINEKRTIQKIKFDRTNKKITIIFSNGRAEEQPSQQMASEITKGLTTNAKALVVHVDYFDSAEPETFPSEVDREYFVPIKSE